MDTNKNRYDTAIPHANTLYAFVWSANKAKNALIIRLLLSYDLKYGIYKVQRNRNVPNVVGPDPIPPSPIKPIITNAAPMTANEILLRRWKMTENPTVVERRMKIKETQR